MDAATDCRGSGHVQVVGFVRFRVWFYRHPRTVPLAWYDTGVVMAQIGEKRKHSQRQRIPITMR